MQTIQHFMDKIWYALYVKSRTEKKVAAELEKQGIINYLPLQKILKQWSDRRKWVTQKTATVAERSLYMKAIVRDAERVVAGRIWP